jgi:hypothetical protein
MVDPEVKAAHCKSALAEADFNLARSHPKPGG